jgi:hypothetical protein
MKKRDNAVKEAGEKFSEIFPKDPVRAAEEFPELFRMM